MVACKEEVVAWFARQPSHQRLDLLCTLAGMCLPAEIRFVSTCVSFLAAKDAPGCRDQEMLAQAERGPLPAPDSREGDLRREALRRQLIWKLMLLHAGNRLVAHAIFRLLCSAQSVPLAAAARDEQLAQELLLIYTMGLHHPSFTLEERIQLGQIYLRLQSAVEPEPAATVCPPPKDEERLSEKDTRRGPGELHSNPIKPGTAHRNLTKPRAIFLLQFPVQFRIPK